MNILVCDENTDYVDRVIHQLRDYTKKESKTFLRGLSSKREILNETKINKYDIAFLDTEIDSLSGIDIAIALLAKNPECLIVFIASDYSCVTEAFSIKAFQYIHKPVDEKRFENIFYSVTDVYKKTQSINAFNTSEGKKYFYPHNILYLETYYANIKIVTEQRAYFSNIKNLKNFREYLSEFDFHQVHQSFFVNFHHVKHIYNDHILLSNGEITPLSPGKKQKVVEEFNKYLLRSKSNEFN